MSDRSRAPLWPFIINCGLTFAVVMLGIQLWVRSQSPMPAEQRRAMELVFRQIRESHVDPPSSEELMWQAIKGMVESTDRHGEFVAPDEVAAFEESTTGTYQGVGIVMAEAVTPITVKYPMGGGPAARAGLEVGDRILAVDGEPLDVEDWDELSRLAREKMLGEPGTEVRLTVERDGQPAFEKSLIRADIQQPAVQWVRLLDADAGLGYAYVRGFQPGVADELKAAIEALDAAAGERGLRGLVLDLRENRGGLLDEGIALTNLFVREGTIVSVRRRTAVELRRHDADPKAAIYADLPLVVIVNQTSASASEVTAGALKDHHRAELVGVRTFGKGVVQSIYQWHELNFRLKLTTAHYYTPDNRCIEKDPALRRADDGPSDEGGIAPHIEVKVKTARRRQIAARLGSREPPAQYRDALEKLAKELDIAVPKPLPPAEDPQLAAALDRLRVVTANRSGAPNPAGDQNQPTSRDH